MAGFTTNTDGRAGTVEETSDTPSLRDTVLANLPDSISFAGTDLRITNTSGSGLIGVGKITIFNIHWQTAAWKDGLAVDVAEAVPVLFSMRTFGIKVYCAETPDTFISFSLNPDERVFEDGLFALRGNLWPTETAAPEHYTCAPGRWMAMIEDYQEVSRRPNGKPSC
ncbi:MAG: hypothetical protein F4X69_15840 [Gemmatimonadetes bacterium]|nr:hypothetical protein [Gemmatimonadota bacterium]